MSNQENQYQKPNPSGTPPSDKKDFKRQEPDQKKKMDGDVRETDDKAGSGGGK